MYIYFSISSYFRTIKRTTIIIIKSKIKIEIPKCWFKEAQIELYIIKLLYISAISYNLINLIDAT